MEILDFYADWCGPCQMMKPIMDEFEKTHPDIKVKQINIDIEEEAKGWSSSLFYSLYPKEYLAYMNES